MLITDRIKNLCLFNLTDEEAFIVEQALKEKSNIFLKKLIELHSNCITESRAVLGEIIDLIGSLFKYGDDEVETIIFENF